MKDLEKNLSIYKESAQQEPFQLQDTLQQGVSKPHSNVNCPTKRLNYFIKILMICTTNYTTSNKDSSSIISLPLTF